MQSEVRFKKEMDGRPVSFEGLRSGEGIVDYAGNLRLKISGNNYIRFSALGETLGVDDKYNWPPHFGSDQPIREFKLVAEEV